MLAMTEASRDSFKTRSDLDVDGKKLKDFSLPKLGQALGTDLGRLPYSLRILVENLLRNETGKSVSRADVEGLVGWDPKAAPDKEIAFHPARVVLQDFTGVP